MKKCIGIVSLGCAKNLIDSEMILGMFPEADFSFTNDPSKADLIIVNTCAFISSAKQESIDTILEMASYGKKLVVVGCLAERYQKELTKELPEADLIIPISSYAELHHKLGELLGKDSLYEFNPLRRVISTSPYSAYLRISEGCNNHCAFCAIPAIRGKFVSRPMEEILEEAKILKDRGVKEISLISQDTTRYGFDFPSHKPDIVCLLKELEAIGFYSIRLLYLYPSEISDELIDCIASSKVIAHYFDIPVQAGSDHLLRLMRRHANQEQTRALFKKIKERCPDAIFRTTLIAGFPGETEEDIEETKAFLEEIKFDHMGCFAYSREEGTPSYSYPGQIKEKVKEARRDELMKLQQKISYEQNKSRIGQVMEGLVIGKDKKEGYYRLRSVWNAPDDIDGNIVFSSPVPLKEGEVVKVKIVSAFIYDLLGEILLPQE